MSWFSNLFKRGFKITIRRDWPGEKELGNPMPPGKVTKEEIEQEIGDSINQKEGRKDGIRKLD